jgi:thiaminase/transcriptional activator TenA
MKKMSYSETLLKSNPVLLKAAIEHPFIAGLCEGTIPKEAFRQYVIQDFMICQAVRRLLSLVVAKLPSSVYDDQHKWVDEIIPALGKQISPGPESKALQLFLKQLSVTQVELTQATLVTRAFSDFIISTGATGGYKESLIVLLAMNFVYESWAEKFESAKPGDPLVKEFNGKVSCPLSAGIDIGLIVTPHDQLDFSIWKNSGTTVLDISASTRDFGWPKFL